MVPAHDAADSRMSRDMKRTGGELVGFKKGEEKHETIAIKNKLGLYKAGISHKARCKGEMQEWAELQWKEF